MASEEEIDDGFTSIEPELPPTSGSEIEGIVDTAAVGADGIPRPVFINQFEEEVLALTYDDVNRLHEFLGLAVEYLKEYRTRITQ